MKKLPLIVVAVVGNLLFAYQQFRGSEAAEIDAVWPISEVAEADGVRDDAALVDAFNNHVSNIQVHGRGRVSKILSDDVEGSRHQRFVVRLSSGQTILIAHNVDLAPRVSALRDGDSIEFSGEYEWNAKGGVVHWTHIDPAGRHQAGWIKYNGRTYQ